MRVSYAVSFRGLPIPLRAVALCTLLTVLGASALGEEPVPVARPPRPEAVATLRHLVESNGRIAEHRPAHFFDAFKTGQHPRATVVACSDSRVQMSDFVPVPDGDLFVVRNIGNQIDTAEGSVEYGIRHLKTPLLLIVGHVECGAVKAALDDYSSESPALRKELDTLHVGLTHDTATKAQSADALLDGVVENVHQQVAVALAEYKTDIDAGTLTVAGAVYDFTDALGTGTGHLVVVDVNGDRNPQKITAMLAAHKSKSPRE